MINYTSLIYNNPSAKNHKAYTVVYTEISPDVDTYAKINNYSPVCRGIVTVTHTVLLVDTIPSCEYTVMGCNRPQFSLWVGAPIYWGIILPLGRNTTTFG